MFLKRRAVFRYPFEPAPRTAMLVGWFGQSWLSRKTVRLFPAGWCPEASAFRPAAVAATLEQLLELSERPDRPALSHSVVVLTRPDDARLSHRHRELLWRAFGVPSFEQIIGENGELLAGECEAHDGLHIDQRSNWGDAQIETSTCPCGRATARLMAAKPAERVRTVAAYAR